MKKLIRFALLLLMLFGASFAKAQGGPVVIMGIDAEDGGPGGHGPITVYQTVATSILSNVSKTGASGILVLGGTPGSQVNSFWNALAAGIGVPVTYAQDPTAITNANFSSYAMLGIASDAFNTSGGLDNAENTALAARAADIAAHVNSGGGLLVFSNCALSSPYAFLGGIGSFACSAVFESQITPTPDGSAVGITDALDVCCWHDAYTTFPSFLKPLAHYPDGKVAAIGGVQVVIPGFVLTPSVATNVIGSSHTVSITVTQTVGGVTNPVASVNVSFSVTGAHTSSGACVTDSLGQCSFTYIGTTTGMDTITATAVVAGKPQVATASKMWTAPPVTAVPFDIKPTSCRNPINTNAEYAEKSVIPAAILGTNRFDVTTIDPATVKLEGVPAIRWSIEDVATPFEPYTGKRAATDCTTDGPDGYRDLTLKFNGQALINSLGSGSLVDGQVMVLKMTGFLKDGTSIAGEDVIVIIKKR